MSNRRRLTRTQWAGVVGASMVGLALVFVILGVMLFSRTTAPAVPPQDAPTPRQRLAELQATDRAALTSYGWIDKQAGTVRIPVERAIELFIQEQAAKAAGD